MHQAIKTIKEAQNRAATKIQSCFRSFMVRKVTQYGVASDIELAQRIKTILDQN